MIDFKPSNVVVAVDYSGNAITATSGVGIRTLNATNDAPLTTRFILTSSGSGGVALTATTSSYPYGIFIKNSSNAVGVSGVVLLGTSSSPPFVSGGYAMAVGESVSLSLSRPDFVRVYGTLSGVSVSWYGQLG